MKERERIWTIIGYNVKRCDKRKERRTDSDRDRERRLQQKQMKSNQRESEKARERESERARKIRLCLEAVSHCLGSGVFGRVSGWLR